jgi:hypothetical protein
MTTESKSEVINQSLGVPSDGFDDATGEYPREKYFFGTSVNAAARGAEINELYVGGGDTNASVVLPDQKASIYPFNQVQETASGHVIEIDDTPGGERILIKHKSGSGVELRADGSTLYSSRKNKVEVVGADQTVIVEGSGKLIYKGNLDVHVTGDYNLTVGGDINVVAHGDKTENIDRSVTSTIGKSEVKTIKENKETTIVGNTASLKLGNNIEAIKGYSDTLVEGRVELNTASYATVTAKDHYSISSKAVGLTGMNVSVVGAAGTIGGQSVMHVGNVFSGIDDASGGNQKVATFYGSLVGRAKEADLATTANDAKNAEKATYADTAGAATIGTPVPTSPVDVSEVYTFDTESPSTFPEPTTIADILTKSSVAPRNVAVDPSNIIKNRILKTTEYADITSKDLNIHQIRALLRTNKTNTTFVGYLVAQDKLSSKYGQETPDGHTGRIAENVPTTRFGYDHIGNNAIENKSKRFTPQERG